MISVFIQQTALYLFKQSLSSGSRLDAKLAWELMHMDEAIFSGTFKPNPEDPDPIPWPDPIGPVADVSPQIMSELIRVAATPLPMPPSLTSVFTDRDLQLKAAISLKEKLATAAEKLDEKIADLKGTQTAC